MGTSHGEREPKRAAGIAAAVFLAAAPPAWANAGTPLMWLPIHHLLIGNIIIGIAEGAALAVLLRTRFWGSIALMVAGNYVSMLLGLALLPRVYALTADAVGGEQERLFVAQTALRLTWGMAVVATVLIEWPLVALAVRRCGATWRRTWRRGFLGSLVAQALSYSCLIPLYGAAGSQSLHTAARGEPTPALTEGRVAGWVYFIDETGEGVRRIRLDGSRAEDVVEVTGEPLRLIPVACEDGGWEIWARTKHVDDVRWMVGAGVGGRVGTFFDIERHESVWHVPEFFSAVDLQTSAEWRASPGFWAIEGLRIWRGARDEQRDLLWLAYETPFERWAARAPTVLDGGLVVYQVGEWIVVVDAAARRWGLLTRGSSPVVVLDR